jgi:SOS response regulatory protein OraA/RecX
LSVLFRPGRRPAVDRLLDVARAGSGLQTAPTNLAGVRQLLRALRAGKAVGLLPDTIDAALAEGPDWHELATQTRVRRFGPEAPADWAERSRQMRFLQYRGFSTDHIRSALGSSGAHPDLDDETDL